MIHRYGYTYATCKVHQIIIISSSFHPSFRLFSAFQCFSWKLWDDHLSRGFFSGTVFLLLLCFFLLSSNCQISQKPKHVTFFGSKIEKPTTKKPPLPRLAVGPLKIGKLPKGNNRLRSRPFSGALNVSFREGIIPQPDFFFRHFEGIT